MFSPTTKLFLGLLVEGGSVISQRFINSNPYQVRHGAHSSDKSDLSPIFFNPCIYLLLLKGTSGFQCHLKQRSVNRDQLDVNF